MSGAIFTQKLEGKLVPYVTGAAVSGGLLADSITAFVTAVIEGDAAAAKAIPCVRPFRPPESGTDIW